MNPIVILGACRTKKNSPRVFRVGKFTKVLPSKAYEKWQKEAVPQLVEQMNIVEQQFDVPISEPVNVKAFYYREKAIGDLNNYHEALADVLEDAGVVTNDKWVMGWDGSRLRKDADNPRVELWITKMEDCDG